MRIGGYIAVKRDVGLARIILSEKWKRDRPEREPFFGA